MSHRPLLLLALASLLISSSTLAGILTYHYKVTASFPHDTNVYTQGLVFSQGLLYESAGQYGESKLLSRKLESLTPLQSHRLQRSLFAEGLTLLDNKLYQLTWKSGRAFVYDSQTLKLTGEFHITGEGWGLTDNGRQLIMSDGSHLLRFLNPENFDIIRTLAVTYQGKPLRQLNELEWIDGQIFANVWQTDWIVMINPDSGLVEGKVNLRDLLPAGLRSRRTDVLNGIAYDADDKRLFVTGKYWPRIYQIELQQPNTPVPAVTSTSHP